MNERKPVTKRIIVEESQPHSLEAEEGVISCFLQDPSLLKTARSDLPEDYFYDPTKKFLYNILLTMDNKGMPIDLVTVSSRLAGSNPSEDKLGMIGGAHKLAELYSFVPTPAHYNYYVSILRDDFDKRAAIETCERIKRSVLVNRDEWRQESLSLSKALDAQLTEKDNRNPSIQDIVSQTSLEWDEEFSGKSSHWMPTRWKTLNKMIGGMTAPSYVLLLGKRGRGKSSFAQNFVTSLSMGANPQKTAYFLYEMSPKEFIKRAVCDIGNVHSNYVFRPVDHKPNIEITKRIANAFFEIEKAPIHVYGKASWNANQVVAELHKIKPTIAVIDYLQIMPPPYDVKDGKSLEVAKTSSLLLQAAMDLKMCLILLSQKSSSEGRDGEASWSDGPENDASLCLSIEDGVVNVKKNRHGEANLKLPLSLDPGYYRFIEHEDDTP